ncbi:hypothetical protein [Levilactobacillus bambusae]|nr:hypothetical protein [Levilactobacillus bambusae]
MENSAQKKPFGAATPKGFDDLSTAMLESVVSNIIYTSHSTTKKGERK